MHDEIPAHAALRLAAKANKAIDKRDPRVGPLAETLMKAVPAADSADRRNVVLGALLQVYDTAYANAKESAVSDANAALEGFKDAVRRQIEQLCQRKIGG